MQNQIEEFSINIQKSQEKQYLKIDFNVPENIETLKISYEHLGGQKIIPGDNKAIIDLAVVDSTGIEVGASGSSKRNVTISPSYSTPGYDAREIKSGIWTIICGAYSVPKDGVDVHYTIEFVPKHRRFLRGDLHIHTVASDGIKTLLQICKMAKKAKLDFIALTDHNNFFQNKHLPMVDNLTIIPGVELTNYMGHMNFWGLDTPYTKPHAVGSLDEFKKLNEEAKERGAVVSINHPFCTLCPWKWDMRGVYYDSIEVWNGPQRLANIDAINWWHNELLSGRKLVAVGGSDYHRDYYVVRMWGKPTNHILCEANSVGDILSAVKNGKIVITKKPNSTFIELTSGSAVVGDSVKFEDGAVVNINVTKLQRNHTLKVYNNDKIIHSFKQTKIKGDYSVKLKVQEKGFVRAVTTYKPCFFEKLFSVVFAKLTAAPKPPKKYPDFVSTLTNPIYFD